MPSARASAGRSPCTTAMPRAGHDAGHAELQRGHPAARAHDAGQLAHRRRRILDVAQQVGERQRVEARVLERQALGLPLDELHTRALAREARPRSGEHLRALVETDDGAVRTSAQLGSDHPRAGRDIEDPLPCLRRHRVDERAPPARVRRSSAPRSAGRSDAAARGTARAPPASSPTPCLHRTWPCGIASADSSRGPARCGVAWWIGCRRWLG